MIKNYLYEIFEVRYFILHLVRWDIKYKFRRSKLGILWTLLYPLSMSIIIALVFGYIFKIPMRDYAPYILCGFIIWDALLGGIIHNSSAFIKADSYIRQIAHPIVIYPLREALVSTILFVIASLSFFVWVGVVFPQNIVIGLLSMPLTVFFIFMLTLPLSIISSHIHVRYRDYQYIVGILMQVLWYFSPVFLKEEIFKVNKYLYAFFTYNPVTSILNLMREPFLYGRLPSVFVYLYISCIILVLFFAAYMINKKGECDVIFYI